jgi:hypothetical protein
MGNQNRFDRLEEKLDKVQDLLQQVTVDHATRIAKLEATQKGFVTIFTTLFTALVAYVASMFHLRS